MKATHFSQRRRIVQALSLSLLLCISQSERAHGEPVDNSVTVMRGIIDRSQVDRTVLTRVYNIPYSPSRVEQLRQLLQQNLADLNSVLFTELDRDAQVDYLLFQNHLRSELSTLGHESARFEEIADLVPFASLIIGLEQTRRRMEHQHARACAVQVSGIPDQIELLRSQLNAAITNGTAPGAVAGRRAAGVVDDLRTALSRWFSFYKDYNPEFTWWLREPPL